MERIFRLKDDNRILIVGSDEVVERDGKFYTTMRSIAKTNFGDDSVPHINIEYKEVEEINIVPTITVDGEEVYKAYKKLNDKKEEV